MKVHLDGLFGRECFLNELVWAYDYGGKTRRRWPPKHDTILVYVKDPDGYHFDDSEVERVPYLAPGLVGPEKAARGKRLTDTWFHTIVPTNGREKTGYPTQKPEGVVRRSSRRRRARAAGAWTSSPGQGRSARWRARWAGASCSSTAIPMRSTSRGGAWPATLTRRCRRPGCSSRPRPSWRSLTGDRHPPGGVAEVDLQGAGRATCRTLVVRIALLLRSRLASASLGPQPLAAALTSALRC